MKISVITATRAEYGILKPLITKLNNDRDIELQLIVTGTHLSKKYGNTQQEIIEDGLPIYRKIDILEEGNTALDVSKTMANAIEKFAKYFLKEKPECVVLLGDRTELMGIACAALNVGIPIAHLHGGELTEGAIDDCIRHAITKMSYIHFVSTDVYRKRIIQMGEEPDRVYNVGALGVENILNTDFLREDELKENLEIPKRMEYIVVTFHPVTMEQGCEMEQVNELISAMKERNQYFYIITKANSDVGGELVNEMFEKFAKENSNVKLVASLGMKRYLSAVKYSKFVLGNSSSGIIEAPSLGTPTVNIGNRQKGRLMAGSIINCYPKKDSIINAIDMAKKMEHIPSYAYGDGNTSGKIVDILKSKLAMGNINTKKKFYDIEF